MNLEACVARICGAASALALLAACGDASSVAPVTAEMAAAAEEAGGIAGVAGAPVSCPAKIDSAPVSSGPVFDVVGVKPGMTYDEAVNVLRCGDNKLAATLKKENTWNINHGGVDIRFGFTAEVPLTQAEEDARLEEIRDSYTGGGGREDPFGVKPGKVRYTASTVGIPGDERVVHMLSEQRFALDALPPVESLKASLIEKYGPPTEETKDNRYRGRTYLYWIRDPAGQPMAQRVCYITSTQYNLGDRCGSMVTAEIEPDEKNFDLATKLDVVTVVSDWGYNHLQKAEADLAAYAAKLRAEGVEKAKDNAEAPKL